MLGPASGRNGRPSCGKTALDRVIGLATGRSGLVRFVLAEGRCPTQYFSLGDDYHRVER